MDLIRLLRDRLGNENLEAIAEAWEDSRAEPGQYEAMFDRVRGRLRASARILEDQERRAGERYSELEEFPQGRQFTLLHNCSEGMLTVLARALIQESYRVRFESCARSRDLAELSLRCVDVAEESGSFSERDLTELRAEVQIFRGNALRISSDLQGAEQALRKAKSLLGEAGADRGLLASYHEMLAHLRFAQGRSEEALDLYSREVKLRRLIGDSPGEGRALLNQGVIQAWSGTVLDAERLFRRAVGLLDDPKTAVIPLYAIAERYARDGKGLDAWTVLSGAQTLLPLVSNRQNVLRLQWIKGITYRALGKYSSAREELEKAENAFRASGETYRAALISLDLAAVAAAEGDVAAVRRHAEAAYSTFKSQGVERRVLASFMILYNAARAEELTEEVAVQVANFMAGFRRNSELPNAAHEADI